jgi:hypothetical protein
MVRVSLAMELPQIVHRQEQFLAVERRGALRAREPRIPLPLKLTERYGLGEIIYAVVLAMEQ